MERKIRERLERKTEETGARFVDDEIDFLSSGLLSTGRLDRTLPMLDIVLGVTSADIAALENGDGKVLTNLTLSTQVSTVDIANEENTVGSETPLATTTRRVKRRYDNI